MTSGDRLELVKHQLDKAAFFSIKAIEHEGMAGDGSTTEEAIGR
jgi:hypothetical protein